MLGLITDRTQQNVTRRRELARKGWSNMTVAERIEWSGNPLETPGANLLPPITTHSSPGVTIEQKLDEIVATANYAGEYIYTVAVIGNASDYANKTLTLSIDTISTTSGGVPRFALFWHDDNGYEFAGGGLYSGGSVTFSTTEWPNYNNRAYLTAYIYVTTTASVSSGAEVRFKGVMLEIGDTRHEYIPYSEIAPTAATKGAYNYSDLNRVERMVEYISALKGLNLVTKTNWTMWEIPKASDMERYLSNIKSIRNSISSSIELPNSMNNLTFTDANNIEKVLMEATEV